MRHWLAPVAVLGACAAPVTERDSLRDMSAPIASQVDVGTARLAGEWVVVAAFAGAGAGPVPGDELSVVPAAGGAAVAEMGMPSSARVDLTADGPGRWRSEGGGWLPAGPVWVLWMDADDRTAVIGRPDGAAGWIMDRSPTGSPDRLVAARDILDWFGYDLTRLREVER